MEYNFPVIRTTHPKPRPADETKLGFAKYFTDHMFVMDYDEGQGWHDGRVVPHEPFLIEPASCVLHYAQMMFEGMKAYRTPDGGVQIFRPDMNIKRMARTNERNFEIIIFISNFLFLFHLSFSYLHSFNKNS